MLLFLMLSGWCLSEQATLATDLATEKWSLSPGDRLVLLGNTFIERENEHSQIELAFRILYPESSFSFRNLGWSGDNVLGESRAYFGPVQAGYQHLQEYINLTKPTVVLVSYGHNVAFEGESALPAFLESYAKLLNDISSEERRIVVLGLTPLEPVHRQASEIEPLNKIRQNFNTKLSQLCQERNLIFVDLFGPLLSLKEQQKLTSLTDNGVHLNQAGYALVAELISQSQGKTLFRDGKLLLLDSKFQQASQPLKQKIHRKNELFFHRFRPQNETYLRGFRKHEQGQNAKEIYEFDPLVQQEEQHLQAITSRLLKSQEN